MGVFDLTAQIISQVISLGPEVLLLLVFVFAIIAFKVFSFVLKAVLTGVVFALFPLIANYLGIPVPLTIQSIVSYALLGIVFYLGYGAISFGFKTTRFVFSPFKRTFKKEKKVIVEKEKKN